jgi:hypothetical protein
MTPPPIAPLPPRRHRSFAGPFVLIIVGTVFLLGTMRILSVARLAHLFANYWPVLLILWGVIKLIEHMQAQREGTRASGIGAGGVLLVIMIVVFGLVATQLEHVDWSGLRENFNFNDGDFPKATTSTITSTRIFPPGRPLRSSITAAQSASTLPRTTKLPSSSASGLAQKTRTTPTSTTPRLGPPSP